MATKTVETYIGNVYNNPGRKHFESLLSKFYSTVLTTTFNMKSPGFLESTKKYMEQIMKSEGKKTKKDPFALIDYKDEACVCAYMHQYCVYYSSTVMGLFIDMLNENTSFRNVLLTKKEIRICCLGGGSGTEAVGIGAAIEHELQNGEHNVDLFVTIIDNCSTWRRIVQKVAKAANKTNSKVKLKIQFLEEDICDPLHANIAASIRKADCITMVNFSSSVFSARTVKKHVIRDRLGEIIKSVKYEAMILYVDSSDDHYGMEIENITEKFSNLLKVYRQQEGFGRQAFVDETTSTRQSLSLKRLEECYLKDYASVSASMWIKSVPPKVETAKAGEEGAKPKVFLPVTRRDPKQGVPSNNKKPLLISKNSRLAKYMDKRNEKIKKEHVYKNAARNSSKSNTRYALDGYD